MRAGRSMRKRRKESGIALLISIFVLLLISVVAIAMIVASGTETSLAGNYRSSPNVDFAALARLEEARGRLLRNSPDYVLKADANFLPPPGTPLAIGDVRYILNPNPALNENMGNVLTTYPDNEYATEFGAGPTPSRPPIASVSPNNAQGIPGPPFKWVRINAVSEISLKLADTYPFLDGRQDPTPLYYDDGRHLNDTNSGRQVFEITALAVLPNASGQSSQKIVQYLVAPIPITLPPFLAALTLSGRPGNDPVFQPPANNNVYAVKGDGDQDCNGNPLPSKVAVGIYGDYSGGSSATAITNIKNGIPSAAKSNYTGSGGSLPDVEDLNTFQTPSQLDAIVQTIVQNADVVLTPGSGTSPTPYPSYAPDLHAAATAAGGVSSFSRSSLGKG